MHKSRRNLLKRTLVILMLNLGVAINISAGNSDTCGCNAALVDGVFNYRSVNGNSEARQDVLRVVISSSYDEFRNAIKADVAVSYFKFGFEASMSKEQFEQHQRKVQQEERVSGSRKDSKEILERYGDQEVLKAWSLCKSSCSIAGLHTWIDRMDDQYFYLGIKYIATTPHPLIVKDSAIRNAKVMRSDVKEGMVLTQGTKIPPGITKIFIHREDSTKSVPISVAIEGSDIGEYIPPVVPPVQPVKIVMDATQFDGRYTGYVLVNPQFSNLVTHNYDHHPLTVPDNVGYVLVVPKTGTYELFVSYASPESRPTEVLLDSAVVFCHF